MINRFNVLSGKDKFDIVKKLRASGFDITQGFLQDYVYKVQELVYAKNISPADRPDNPVEKVVGQGNDFYRLYKNGRTEKINKDVYSMEAMYNFVPDRFRTYVPGKSS